MEFFSSLFAANPGTQFKYYILMLVLIAVLVIKSIVFAQIYKKKKKHDLAFKHFFKKTAGRLLLFAFLLGLFTASRYEAIPYFSMRLWLYLTILFLIYFLGKTAYIYKEKYLPEKKHAESKLMAKAEKSHAKVNKSYTAKKNKR